MLQLAVGRAAWVRELEGLIGKEGGIVFWVRSGIKKRGLVGLGCFTGVATRCGVI